MAIWAFLENKQKLLYIVCYVLGLISNKICIPNTDCIIQYSTKMKLSPTLSAAAQAWILPQSTLDLPSQQLEQVVNFFRFSSENCTSIKDAVDIVS